MNTEPAALWEEALQEQEEFENRLADEIVTLARYWAADSTEQLREAERILARTPYLEGEGSS